MGRDPSHCRDKLALAGLVSPDSACSWHPLIILPISALRLCTKHEQVTEKKRNSCGTAIKTAMTGII
jgi:hypothetical protein